MSRWRHPTISFSIIPFSTCLQSFPASGAFPMSWLFPSGGPLVKKQRHYFANKGLSSQSYGFSSSHEWMWELDYKESWAPKNWCFQIVVWRWLTRVPWTAGRSNQTTLRKFNPKYSLEGLMRKLKLLYFGHLMWRADSLEKTLMLGKTEGKRRKGWQDEMVR